MADPSEQLNQDEIEALLQQSRTAGDKAPPSKDPAPASEAKQPADSGGSPTLDQSEIEALMQSAGKAPGSAGASNSATSPPQSAAPSPDGGTAGNSISQDDIDFLLNRAEAALASIDSTTGELPDGVCSFKLEDFSGTPASSEAATLDLMRDVELDVRIELGRTHMYLEEVLKLNQGAVVSLDRLAGDPVDIYVNGRLIARGEVLVLNDNFCVRVAELIVGDSACA